MLLPRVGKACILCNWAVNWYSLPELTPVLRQVKNCNWIGGVDLNESLDDAGGDQADDVTMLLSTNQRIKVVRVEDDARVTKVGSNVEGQQGTQKTDLFADNWLRRYEALHSPRHNSMCGRWLDVFPPGHRETTQDPSHEYLLLGRGCTPRGPGTNPESIR